MFIVDILSYLCLSEERGSGGERERESERGRGREGVAIAVSAERRREGSGGEEQVSAYIAYLSDRLSNSPAARSRAGLPGQRNPSREPPRSLAEADRGCRRGTVSPPGR